MWKSVHFALGGLWFSGSHCIWITKDHSEKKIKLKIKGLKVHDFPPKSCGFCVLPSVHVYQTSPLCPYSPYHRGRAESVYRQGCPSCSKQHFNLNALPL